MTNIETTNGGTMNNETICEDYNTVEEERDALAEELQKIGAAADAEEGERILAAVKRLLGNRS